MSTEPSWLAVDADGQTALHYAALGLVILMCSLLLLTLESVHGCTCGRIVRKHPLDNTVSVFGGLTTASQPRISFQVTCKNLPCPRESLVSWTCLRSVRWHGRLAPDWDCWRPATLPFDIDAASTGLSFPYLVHWVRGLCLRLRLRNTWFVISRIIMVLQRPRCGLAPVQSMLWFSASWPWNSTAIPSELGAVT